MLCEGVCNQMNFTHHTSATQQNEPISGKVEVDFCAQSCSENDFNIRHSTSMTLFITLVRASTQYSFCTKSSWASRWAMNVSCQKKSVTMQFLWKVKQNRIEFLIQLFVEPYRFFVQSISFQNKNVILLFSLFSWKRTQPMVEIANVVSMFGNCVFHLPNGTLFFSTQHLQPATVQIMEVGFIWYMSLAFWPTLWTQCFWKVSFLVLHCDSTWYENVTIQKHNAFPIYSPCFVDQMLQTILSTMH